jgi:uncharacterized protein YndB with AHSA1/START domain
MTQTLTSPIAHPAVERKLVLTRVFDAPRSLVYKAWTDPQQLAQWWGPTGFTNPVCELDLKPYGEIRIDMRGPDGTVYPMAGAFREIAEPERLVFTSAALDGNGKPMFENLNTVTFEEFEGSKTLLTIKVNVLWESEAAAPALAGMSLGWSLTIDRLADFVTTGSVDTSNREISAMRLFNAPRELVFRMWTEAEHVKQWWGPRGFTNTIHHMDVRPGGEWRLIMHGPDGRDYPNEYIYEEVIVPERLVLHHVNAPVHRKYISFFDAGEGTMVSVRLLFETAELRTHVAKEYGAEKGLLDNLDRLQEHLADL